LIATSKKASNRIVDIEDLTEDELDQLHKFYEKIGKLPKEEKTLEKKEEDPADEEKNRRYK